MKDQLAILGGQNSVPKEFQQYKHPRLDVMKTPIVEQLSSTMISYEGGGIFYKVESAFQKAFNTPNALSFNSGTNALFALYYGSGLKEGDDVLVPGYTFFATATPLFLLGCNPILVDCNKNGNIALEDVEKKITSRTKAIVATHVWGVPCEMDALERIARKNNLLLLEDASHAHGATFDGKDVGTIGDGAAWSLGAKKLITGGQGGMLSTPHRDIYERAILLGHFHRLTPEEVRNASLAPFVDTGTGLNCRMHPYSAATIIEQIKSYSIQLEQRREVAEMLKDEISKISGLEVPSVSSRCNPSWYAFPILYHASHFQGLKKELFIKAVQEEGAIHVSTPNYTCSLTNFYPFKIGFTGRSVKSYDTNVPIETLKNCEAYEEKLFKMPVFYGNDRFKCAKFYLKAIKKVAIQYQSLLL